MTVALPMLLVTGCTDTSAPQPHEAASAAPTPAIDPVEAEAVIHTYRTWRDLQNEVLTGQRSIDEVQDELDALVTGQAADGLQESMDFHEEQGVISQGKSKIDPKITAMNLNGTPPTAVLVDCLDTSGSDLVDTETGKSRKAPSEVQSERVVVTARSEQTPEGDWIISEISTDFDRSC